MYYSIHFLSFDCVGVLESLEAVGLTDALEVVDLLELHL